MNKSDRFLDYYISALTWFMAILVWFLPLIVTLLLSIFLNCWWIMFGNLTYIFVLPLDILLFEELRNWRRNW